MARLWTVGWEVEQLSTVSGGGGEGGSQTVGAPTIETGSPRTGAAHLRVTQQSRYEEFKPLGNVLGRAFWMRFYFRTSTAAPTNALEIASFVDQTGSRAMGLRILPAGTLEIRNAVNAVIGSTSPALTAGAWYRIELKCLIDAVPTTSNGILETRLYDTDDRTLIWNESLTNARLGLNALNRATVGGSAGGALGGNADFDDFAINDDQGSDQNSWPGPGRAVLLKPKADNARGANWTTSESSGNTTDLWDALDNRPPQGKADTTGDSNPTKVQVRNAASTNTENLDVDVESYDEAGIPSAAPIALVQALVRYSMAASSASSTGIGVKAVSNPADSAEATALAAFIAAAAEPSGWFTLRGNVVYAPSPTRGTRPVVRVGKRTLTTRVVMADLLGLYVEYVDPVAIAGTDSGSLSESSQVDVIGGGPTDVPVTESGAGADSSSLAASSAISDSGAEGETSALAASSSAADSATGSEASAPARSSAVADSGAGSDASSLSPSAAGTEAGSGSEASAYTATAATTDAGTGAESSSIVATPATSDAGAGSESAATSVPLAGVDAATGADASSLSANVQRTDAATGTDSSSLSSTAGPSGSDAGAAGESSSVSATGAGSDSSTGSEALSVSVTLARADSGTGTESSNVAASTALTASDAGSSTETATVVVLLAGVDTAALSEGVLVVVELVALDGGAFSSDASAVDVVGAPGGPPGHITRDPAGHVASEGAGTIRRDGPGHLERDGPGHITRTPPGHLL